MNTSYITAKRKCAVARIYKRKDEMLFVNGERLDDLNDDSFVKRLNTILGSTPERNGFSCYVKGGGQASQKDAVVNGVALLVSYAYPACKRILKDQGFITRDVRQVERKKYGFHKARKGLPFKKR